MFVPGDRVELVQPVEVFGLGTVRVYAAGARWTVFGILGANVVLTSGANRVTLPPRLLRRV